MLRGSFVILVGWRGVYHGPFGLMIVCGYGEQHGQYGAGPGRAVKGHAAALVKASAAT
jgi:hypothetical protein